MSKKLQYQKVKVSTHNLSTDTRLVIATSVLHFLIVVS